MKCKKMQDIDQIYEVFFSLKEMIEKEIDNENTNLHHHYKDGGDHSDYGDFLPEYLHEITQKAFYLLAWGRIERILDDQLRKKRQKHSPVSNISFSKTKQKNSKLYKILTSLFDIEKEVNIFIELNKIYDNRNLIAHGNDDFESIDLKEIIDIDIALKSLFYIPNPSAEAEEKVASEDLLR
jgi:hypothetical protein